MSMPDEMPNTQEARIVVAALQHDGFCLLGAQLFSEDINEIDSLYKEIPTNELAVSKIRRIIEAAKECTIESHNPPNPGELEEPKDCWAVKIFGKISSLEQSHFEAKKSVMKQRKVLWKALGTA